MAKRQAEKRRETDPIAVWGRRVGRFLGYAALVVMAIYLVMTYGPQ